MVVVVVVASASRTGTGLNEDCKENPGNKLLGGLGMATGMWRSSLFSQPVD